jgi:hypothetical protein
LQMQRHFCTETKVLLQMQRHFCNETKI